MSENLDYQNMLSAIIVQAVSYFQNLKTQYGIQNEIYALDILADQIFQNQSDPIINANAITKEIDNNLKLELHSPRQSDLRILLILNDTNKEKKVHLKVHANIGVSKAFGLFQLNYSNFDLTNTVQVLFNANQHIKINEQLDLHLKPKDLICVLVGNINNHHDEEETKISLIFNEQKESSCSMTLVLIAVIVIILILVLLYLLLRNDEKGKVKNTFSF